MSIGPGKAVGSYFIPVANFVIPYRAMRGISRATFGKCADGHVMMWWALVVVRNLVPSYASHFFDRVFAMPGDPPLFILIDKIFSILGWLLLVTGILLVLRITNAQSRLAAGTRTTGTAHTGCSIIP
jgi:hypothetical protein